MQFLVDVIWINHSKLKHAEINYCMILIFDWIGKKYVYLAGFKIKIYVIKFCGKAGILMSSLFLDGVEFKLCFWCDF